MHQAELHDPYIKDNIARFVTSFTTKFYGDDNQHG